MNFKMDGTNLVIAPEGRIDSANAEAVGKEIDEIMAANAYENVVIDAEKLEYISSAGLRVVLKVRKAVPDLKIVNVSSEVYEIFDMTGFTEMINVEKAFRQMSVDGCKIIGQGAKGTVYRYDGDTIIKVYKNPDSLPDIKRERELAKRAFVLGIPTAISFDIVKVGENYGSVFELLDAKTFSQMIVEDEPNRDHYIEEYALLAKRIHETTVRKDDMPDIKPLIRKWLDTAKPYLDAADAEKLAKLIEETPDTLNMLHCDYHTNNVMLQNGETLLIDMDTLAHGHPIFELANVYITYVGFGLTDPQNVEKFLGMPYAMAKYVWEKFLPVYMGTTDETILRPVEDKARMLCDLRAIRHMVRRGVDATVEAKVKKYSDEIHALLPTIDSLDF